MAKGRSNASARSAGQAFERLTANYLNDQLGGNIDIQTKRGSLDLGDIAGLQTARGGRVTVECKNVRKMTLGPWVEEAEAERRNAKAVLGVVVHKRHGKGDPGSQFVTMTLATLVELLRGGDS